MPLCREAARPYSALRRWQTRPKPCAARLHSYIVFSVGRRKDKWTIFFREGRPCRLYLEPLRQLLFLQLGLLFLLLWGRQVDLGDAPFVAAALETRAEELVDDGDGLVVRDEACRQYEYVGVVVQTRQLGYLGYPAQARAYAAVLLSVIAIPSPEPHIPMPAGSSPKLRPRPADVQNRDSRRSAPSR